MFFLESENLCFTISLTIKMRYIILLCRWSQSQGFSDIYVLTFFFIKCLVTLSVYEMIVRGYYRHQEMFKVLVENEEGCVIFYNQPKKVPEENLSRMTLVPFPEITEQIGMSEKNAQYTRKVTEVMEKGYVLPGWLVVILTHQNIEYI